MDAQMNTKLKEQINNLLAELDEAGSFIQPISTEEAIRDFLARDRGPEWRGAQLQANELFGCVVYTATLVKMLGGKWYPITYVIDRDLQGQFYLAEPSPVAGYES